MASINVIQDNASSVQNISKEICDFTTDISTPITTSNSIKDVIDWLASGDQVELCDNYDTQKYHNCKKFPNSKKRIITVHLNKYPNLMNEDEWSYYILHEGNTLCTCTCDTTESKQYHFIL